MQLPSLPPELVDQIIENLKDDPMTLKCCASVCRGWLSPSRFRIFRRITLEPREPSRPFEFFRRKRKSALQSLVDAIKASPEIASYIREVEIVEGIGAQEWIGNEPLLFFFLALLKHVTRFKLRHSAVMPISWNSLSTEFKIELLRFLASSLLCEINLGMLSHLRILHFDHIQITESSNDPFETPLADRVIFHPTRAHLETLVLGALSNNFEEFARLLRSAFNLKSLEILLMSDIDLGSYQQLPLPGRFDLSHNLFITTLSVRIDVIQRQDDPLPWLNTLLSTFTAPNKLRNIYVVYSLYLPSPYMDRSVNTSVFSNWQEIDTTLTGPTFDALEEVRLEFSLENPIGFGVAPRFLEEVDLQSPALRASNRLVVEAFDTSR
ncbi:hypothetical protein C0989_004282 [Termitomyces sp. Mn162]|nr:hypothetical protein C0989_004282 [Termitomyces sp. Mn162]